MKTKKTVIILAMTIVIAVFAVAGFYLALLQPKSAPKTFRFNLTATPDKRAVVQGGNTTITVKASYVGGDALPVMLSAVGGPNGTVYQFSNQTGTPTAKHPFTSNLTIYVPTSAVSDSYVVDVFANTSAKTCQAIFNLMVAYSEIQVSGTVTINTKCNIEKGIILDVIPTDILFTSNTTGETYQAKIHRFTDTKEAPGKTGNYSISLPNQQSHVDFYCFSFPHYIPVPRKATSGIENGYFTVSCDTCTTSLSADFTG